MNGPPSTCVEAALTGLNADEKGDVLEGGSREELEWGVEGGQD